MLITGGAEGQLLDAIILPGRRGVIGAGNEVIAGRGREGQGWTGV